VDQEEVHTGIVRERSAHLEIYLLLRAHLTLFSSDLDDTTLSSWASLVINGAREGLVSTSDHLVDGEFERANEVVTGKVVEVVHVIDVVNLDLELFAALKVVLDIEALHPSGSQVVHDDFGHANALPLSAYLFGEDQHSVCASKRVEVG